MLQCIPKLQEYRFLDEEIKPGKIYYRIKQVDFDGHFDYSGVRSVNIRADEFINVFPNPIADDVFRLEVLSSTSKDYRIAIYDLTGRLIQEESFLYNQVNVNIEFKINLLPSIPAGSYFVKVFDKNGPLLTKQINKI